MSKKARGRPSKKVCCGTGDSGVCFNGVDASRLQEATFILDYTSGNDSSQSFNFPQPPPSSDCGSVWVPEVMHATYYTTHICQVASDYDMSGVSVGAAPPDFATAATNPGGLADFLSNDRILVMTTQQCLAIRAFPDSGPLDNTTETGAHPCALEMSKMTPPRQWCGSPGSLT